MFDTNALTRLPTIENFYKICRFSRYTSLLLLGTHFLHHSLKFFEAGIEEFLLATRTDMRHVCVLVVQTCGSHRDINPDCRKR